MPQYTYKCESDGTRFDAKHKMSEAAPRCPQCGGKVRKVVQDVFVLYTGSGFYKTDNARKVKKE